MRNILFYGDSNTWGFDPETGLRYPWPLRWTSVCAEILGENCIPAGMNGRTTIFDDPLKGCRNGLRGLDYALQTHKPLDLLVIMLGTNDLKYTNARGSAEGMAQLVGMALSANERFSLSSPVFQTPRILLIAPVLLRNHVGERYDDIAESAKLAGRYRHVAEENRLYFLNAASHAEPSPIDGIHLGTEGHQALGRIVADEIRRIFGGG